MRKHHLLTPVLLGLGLLVLANLVPQTVAAAAEAQAPGTARVWFLRRPAHSMAMCGQRSQRFTRMARRSATFRRKQISSRFPS